MSKNNRTQGNPFTVTVNANKLQQNITVTTGRGNVVGISLYVNDATAADFINGSVTVQLNGQAFLDTHPLSSFGYIFGERPPIYPCMVLPSQTIQVFYTNATGTAFPVNFVLYFDNN